MRMISFVFTIGLILASSVVGANISAESEIVQWYHQHYPFISMKDSIYTFRSEFKIPDDFNQPDSSQLTDYQNWVANFPLWHQWKPIHIWKGMLKYKAEEISRGVHLPYRGQDFKDYAIPVAMLAEYLHYRNRESELCIFPRKGDILRYNEWLRGKLRYKAHGEVFIEPGEEKDTSIFEYYRFAHMCMANTSYESLARNCDSVAARELLPG
ncbi:MAG: DUF4846 domain-containing protein, partial [candidate division Zixibacteria bacterium]|nr:DUF4846 domain-containing protein [candidate division Zixibacteria bacterium]